MEQNIESVAWSTKMSTWQAWNWYEESNEVNLIEKQYIYKEVQYKFK